MDEKKFLADQFETNRTHLKAVAYRMLGSRTEADDAVQEAWLRLSRSDAGEVANIGGWLRTVVTRICLDTTFMSSIICKLIRKNSRKQFVRCGSYGDGCQIGNKFDQGKLPLRRLFKPYFQQVANARYREVGSKTGSRAEKSQTAVATGCLSALST